MRSPIAETKLFFGQNLSGFAFFLRKNRYADFCFNKALFFSRLHFRKAVIVCCFALTLALRNQYDSWGAICAIFHKAVGLLIILFV